MTIHDDPPPLILRAVNGALEPFEPRAHPEPWILRRTRRERRRVARRGARGRRGTRRCALVERRPADRLPEMWMEWGAVDHLSMSAAKVVLECRLYETAFISPCPYRARRASCNERCVRENRHRWTVTAYVYAEDHAPCEAQVERLIAAEAAKLRGRRMDELEMAEAR